MLDIKLIREHPDLVKAELGKRGVEAAEVERVLVADQRRRKIQAELDQLRAERKRRSKEVGKLPPQEREAAIAQIRQEEADEAKAASLIEDHGESAPATRSPIVQAAIDLAAAERDTESLALMLPNIPRPYVLVGASEAD
ncbi:MAG TPA: hypothetical protein VEU51_07770, partial [Candidatus Acidoferrales bacterium]|nr:hypothetical protein [Candidatus Acidoferrales bacterium]